MVGREVDRQHVSSVHFVFHVFNSSLIVKLVWVVARPTAVSPPRMCRVGESREVQLLDFAMPLLSRRGAPRESSPVGGLLDASGDVIAQKLAAWRGQQEQRAHGDTGRPSTSKRYPGK